MSFPDIEKLIGSPMQIPVDMNSGNEYYQPVKNDGYADDEMSEIDNNDDNDNDNEMSDNSIEYSDLYDDYVQQASQDYYYQQPTQYQLEEQYKQKQNEIQKKQQQEEQYKKFIESLQFMSLNEQQIMLYQGNSEHCIIQMEF